MIQGYDPRHGKPMGEPVAETGSRELESIAGAARAAFQEWQRVGSEGRATVLARVADRLDAAVGDLVEVADMETALGETRLVGEIARTTYQLRHFAEVLRGGTYQDIVLSPEGDGTIDLRRFNQPIGPVGVFSASNFPFAFSVAGNDTASALAAGCSVVVKAHEGHPRTSVATYQIVADAMCSAGAPEGVFNVIFGMNAGVRLIKHPSIAAVGFTGSQGAGRVLARVCAERSMPIPFFGEFGSVNPVVILPDAAASRGEEIASNYIHSLTLGAGQFCTNPGLLFAPEGSEVFLQEVAERVLGVVGKPMLSGRIHNSYEVESEELSHYRGVTLLGEGLAGEGPWSGIPRVFRVGLADFEDGLAGIANERFGPVGLVVTYASMENLVNVLGQLEGNLVGVVHADESSAVDMGEVSAVVGVLSRHVGRIVFNGWPTGVAVADAQHHGGPWPATTMPGFTSVGGAAIRRWLVPIAYQNFPPNLLPSPLRGVRQPLS